jgi:type I restriction enzyme S subunit
VKVIASINDETLTEAVDPEHEIEYVDIGSVSLSKGIEKTETMLFGDSPSRARRLPREGDVLVSTVRTYLKAIAPVANQPSNLVASTGFAVVRPKPEIEPSYLKYALQEEHFIQEVISRSTGVSYPAINASDIGRVRVSVPGKDEQQLIATFLDREITKIDVLIDEQQSLIELLQEKRLAVISHAVTKGLNPNVPMKDSGVEWLGEVPEHWDVLPCRAFLKERDSRNSDYGNDYYLSLVAGRGVIPYEEKGDIGNKKPEDLGKCKLVYEGDFVINSMNYGIGSYGVSRFHGVCSPVYIVVTPSKELTHAGFAFRVLENKWFQQYAQSFGNGILAHRCAISWDILKNINAGIPPAEEQIGILSHLDEETKRFEQLTSTARKQVALLQERRSALISAAVTGQIDVRGLGVEEEP